jgi:hypothetical protein
MMALEKPAFFMGGLHFLDGHRLPRLHRALSIARVASPDHLKISLVKYPSGARKRAEGGDEPLSAWIARDSGSLHDLSKTAR